MRQPPYRRERRPGQDGVQEMHSTGDGGITQSVTDAAEPPIALTRAVAELLELSGERDRWMDRLGVEYRLGWKLGYAAGVDEGRRLEAAERDRAWSRAAGVIIRGETYDELELRRWGPGGRAHFGDTRPGDYQGRQAGAA
jgi:hypothetical protein